MCAFVTRYANANLVAYISQDGLHGEIHFLRYNATTVEIRTDLETTLQFPEQVWSWGISQHPVDYTKVEPSERCSSLQLGKAVIEFDDDLGFLQLPGNETSTWFKNMSLIGPDGIWSKSIVFTNLERNVRACGTIIADKENAEHLAEAKFRSIISGSVYFKWVAMAGENNLGTIIHSNLFHVNNNLHGSNFKAYTEHSWKIYATDIFDHDHHRSELNCNFLQQVFDPQGHDEREALGDLDARLGKIKISTNPLKQLQRILFYDQKLVLSPFELNIPHRTLYLVIIDSVHPENFIACAKIRHIQPTIFRTFINGEGIKGNVVFSQKSIFNPTVLNFTMSSAGNKPKENLKFAEDIASFHIHELPPFEQEKNKREYCASCGNLFNPKNLEKETFPPPGFGTQDQYAIGDLSGKLQSRNKNYYHNYIIPGASSELNGIYWDVFLPLYGKDSISHRGLVLYKYNRSKTPEITEDFWACGTILPYENNGFYQLPMFTAQVLFRYPIVGKILFRQAKEDPWYDTAVLIEYLIHADGSTQNSSYAHRWAINEYPPGRDFYNWSGRCLSAGEIYNPYKVSFKESSPEDTCTSYFPGLCRLGDFINRLGTISIAGSKVNASRVSRKLFIDNNIPLSGTYGVLGKSLVIYDDFGPKARGERLGCGLITGYYGRKAVARDWYSNGGPLSVEGKVEIFQQSEYDLSNVEVELNGLINVSAYHIHTAPIEANLAFPCEKSSLRGIWNPRNLNSKNSLNPLDGSTDQYMIGDLSGKFGTLEGYKEYKTWYNDTNLPLFGYESILGRSIVIHKKADNQRWACSTIEAGYSLNDARQVSAIASFHHPAGYAYGYIRMQQLVYPDGSSSETVMEVNLRHPGKNDRNYTRDHHWRVYVNPVGVDAAVKQTITRCVAGGYIWNPYYTQLADPLNTELYSQECGPDNPLRCYVGDISARVGKIDLGGKRVVFSDPNLPLDSPISAIGRSIVIFGANSSEERFACANIEYDHDIIKYINLQKPPRFLVAQFMEDVRQVTQAPEWMLNVDARTVKTLHGGACIQMIMHFKGPYAHQLEVDLSGLLAAGVLYKPSVYIPGYSNVKQKFSLPYRTCEVFDPNEKSNKQSKSSAFRIEPCMFIICSTIFIYLLNTPPSELSFIYF